MRPPTVPRYGRIVVLLCIATLAMAQGAAAADRVNVMTTWRAGSIEPWQVRPGATIDLFGNAGTGGGIGDGSATGETYTWSCVADNPGNVTINDDGLLTGTLNALPAGPLWSSTGPNDRYVNEAVSFNLVGSTREFVTCTLTVDDLAGGVDSDSVVIDVVDPTDMISDTPLENLAIEVNIAIQDGLRFSYLNQQANGAWFHTFSNSVWHCGTTGFTVWAFANSGHLPTNDVETDMYAEFVQQGVDYILSLAATPAFAAQPNIGDPDGDGNGRVISLCGPDFTFYTGYATPIAAAGIIAAYSAAPLTLVPAGAFAGETYAQIIQDVIDWSAYAQAEGVARGGWRYYANYPGADTSVDSWHYLAAEGFETVFGGSVLELVKQEAERRINQSQSQGGPGDLGQFGYQATTPIAFDGGATTAGGLSGLAMVTAGGRVPPLLDGGVLSSATFPDSSTRKAAAVAHLGLRWDAPASSSWEGNRGNAYAMWTTARALRLNATGLLVDKNAVNFDWESGEDQANPGVLPPDNDVHEGYFPYLVRTQLGSGAWLGSAVNGNWSYPLTTAWGILILQPTVFGPPDVTPPSCQLTAVFPGPPLAIQVTAQDGGTGLAAINILQQINATVIIPGFAVGTTSPVVVDAAKIINSQAAHLTLEVFDVAGNRTECDPVLTEQVRSTGKPVTATFTDLPDTDRYVRVMNSTPGLKSLEVRVNGHKIQVSGMVDDEVIDLDCSEFMVPGDDNVYELTARGKPGGSAAVMIWDGQ